MEFEIEKGVLLRYTGSEDAVIIPETVNVITTYQDIFIGEQMAASKVNFI